MRGISLTKSIFVLMVLSINFSAIAKEDKYNLAFDDSFISYLSDRLALQIARKEHLEPLPNLNQTEAGFRAMHLMDIQMAYRAKLISCEGPLEELSKYLEYFEFESDETSRNTGVLAFIGSKEYLIWPIVENWNKKIEDEIIRTHHKGFKVFPDCVVKEYKIKTEIKED